MSAPAWIEPFLTWLTSNPITTTALRRIEGNTKHLRDGDTVFSGTKQFQNNVEMLSQLIVRAETILREVVQISGSLSMLGNMSVNERPGFSGTGNVIIGGSGNLTVGGNTNISGNIDVTGNAVINGSINVKNLGALTISTISHNSFTDTVIPQGIYYGQGFVSGTTGGNVSSVSFTAPGVPGGSERIRIGGTFDISTQTTDLGMIFSDGVNLFFRTEQIASGVIGDTVHNLTLIKISV